MDKVFGRFFGAFNRVFKRGSEAYGGGVRRVISHRAVMLAVYVVLLGLSIDGLLQWRRAAAVRRAAAERRPSCRAASGESNSCASASRHPAERLQPRSASA